MKISLGKRGIRVHGGKLVAGCAAAVLVAALGVVAVQAEEVSSCWKDFDSFTDTDVFPDAYTVKFLDRYDDPTLRTAQRDPDFRAATAFTGDTAIGIPVWTVAAPGANPSLEDQLGLLTARGGADPGDLSMYEGRNGKRHWMRAANAPVDYFMKNLRALTFVPQSDGSTNTVGADARSGYLQWCSSVPLTPAAGQGDTDSGWVTGTTGNGRTVLLVGTPKGGPKGKSTIAYQDVVTGKVTRQWTVDGAWTDVASDGKLVYVAAPGAVAAFKPGAAQPAWRAPLPADGGPTGITGVRNGLALVTAQRPGAPAELTAYDTTGRPVWRIPGADAANAVVTGDLVLMQETRNGAQGVAAYRISDGTPVWFAAVPGLTSIATGGTDGTLLYLPGPTGPRVVRVADGTPEPTTLKTPVDRILVSGQRVVLQHTAGPELAWTVAYLTPKAQAETTTNGSDPRQR